MIKGRIIPLILWAALGLSLTLVMAQLWAVNVSAQSMRPEEVAEIVYQRLGYLPKENGYISKETGAIASNNTLVSRFIRYHEDIKKRPNLYRLDWKLTLADYLGANENIKEERYPGSATLTVNPMEADRKLISGLNRRQRDQLISAIISIYNPPPKLITAPSPVPQASPSPTPFAPVNNPPLSKPGDAQLLLP
ncbi:MAG: hypothetical protein N5P05_000924 [Chroococcopsis gigantea SAG 12.99]|nr:hypothetical protein [Chroococcopsis gigantea SAG 12.99]